ncbi:MAG: chemotaxis protein CheD [Candidatus Auribacterota bacterium]|nr:chemotaxis protein CheD [Candidatus Auribacterota bacterium]
MNIIYVSTSEVKVGRRNDILKSSGIGSCVVITAYHPGKKIGVMAHVMLPGASPGGKDIQRTRYAADAIDEVIERMRRSGVNQDEIEVCLVGGGNVLKREDDRICENIVRSVTGILNEKQIRIKAQSLGGIERRSVSLDIDTGVVRYTVGDGGEDRFTQIREKSTTDSVSVEI